MAQKNTVLVLGATGGIGGEVARQMRAAGWDVRAMQRNAPQAPARRDGITWIRGDAMNAKDVASAAKDCAVIVHAVNPPGYRKWAQLVLPMLDNTIAAAGAGVTIVLPGTVYNFGPGAFPVLRETSPQEPQTRKGAIRVQMERRLQDATKRGVRVLIVRAGDFFGATAGSNTWFAQGLIKPGQAVTKVSNPGAAGVGHQWSYLPDVARTMVELLARREALEPFATFHMAGHWDADGTQMAQAIQRVVARRTSKQAAITNFPWWLLTLAAPFVTTFREMQEMRYLWRETVGMDNAKLVATLGYEPHTSLDEAVETALIGLRCLPADSSLPAKHARTLA